MNRREMMASLAMPLNVKLKKIGAYRLLVVHNHEGKLHIVRRDSDGTVVDDCISFLCFDTSGSWVTAYIPNVRGMAAKFAISCSDLLDAARALKNTLDDWDQLCYGAVLQTDEAVAIVIPEV